MRKTLHFYATVAFIYYLTVKTGIAIAEHFGKSIPDLKNYRVDIATDPSELTSKLHTVFHELTQAPLSSLFHVPTWLSLAILLGPAGIMFYEGRRLGWGRSGSILAAAVYLASVPVILVASVSPWLLSHFSGATYRHMLPIHFFLILSFGILVARGIEKIHRVYGEQISHRTETALMIGLISIFSINQIALSQRQVIDSTIELSYMRAVFREMVESGKLWNLNEIHIVRPVMGRSYDGQPTDREFSPATMANPEHILQITRAVLRDTLSPEQLRRIHLVDCIFDRSCARSAPENVLVVSQGEYGSPLPALRKNHAIINYSRLNKAPILKKIPVVPIKISVSSQLENYSPAYILDGFGPHFWHAEKKPQYPQWVQFEYPSPQKLSTLSIKAQFSSKLDLTNRAPKHFVFQASNDGRSWTDLIEVKDAGFTSENVWRTFQFENDKEYAFYRIYILANGGNPSLLTIQQIALN